MSHSTSAAGFFEPTAWSTILQAQVGGEEARQAAMARLLTRYRQPIFKHILSSLPPDRRTPEQAEDLTQAFIHQCLRLDFLKGVQPERGRFRSFVKRCVANFLRDQHAWESAGKRGGGKPPLSLDQTDEEGRRLLDPAGPQPDPASLLDREWAACVLQCALTTLKQECAAAGRGALFEALQGALGHKAVVPAAADIGAKLAMSEGAVHTAMNRLRNRLGELIRDEIRQTAGTEEDWHEELRYLIALSGM